MRVCVKKKKKKNKKKKRRKLGEKMGEYKDKRSKQASEKKQGSGGGCMGEEIT